MLSNIFRVILISLFFFSCENKNADNSQEIEEAFPETHIANVKSTYVIKDTSIASYTELIKYYIDLKDALVESDMKEASKNALLFKNYLNKLELHHLPDSLHNYWLEQKDIMLLFANEINKSKEIKLQRQEFYSLSQDFYDLYMKIGINDKKIYKQFCPMAFHDKGAFWLSDREEIFNPYFGAEMLHCGEIVEIIND